MFISVYVPEQKEPSVWKALSCTCDSVRAAHHLPGPNGLGPPLVMVVVVPVNVQVKAQLVNISNDS